jgi:PIN domain nuclease of toxin-antitoxin system
MDRAAASGDEIGLSAISLSEIVYLIEKRRLPPNLYRDLRVALSDPECVLQEVSLRSAIVDAMSKVPRIEVPDMPDRIIAATALYFGVPVISRDGKIRTSSVPTVW